MNGGVPYKYQVKPSTSTVAGGGIGTAVSILIVWVTREFAEIEIPGEVGAAIGSIAGALIGYFFPGGKSADHSNSK